MNQYQNSILSQYKPVITPKEIINVDLVKYLDQNFNCTDISYQLKDSLALDFIIANCRHYRELRHISRESEYNIKAIKVLKDDKSRMLYVDPSEDDELIVYIDTASQYFETGNDKLFYLLAIERSVSYISYSNNDIDLLDLASLMYIHDHPD